VATFWWSWSRNRFPIGPNLNIGDVRRAVAEGLFQLGYTGVQSGGDAHGFKGGFVLAVAYLEISGPDFWQVVACGGNGTVADAQAEVNEVTKMISELKFL
jgi:hypothetical protein